jgi:hypothetical protein
MNKPKIGDWSAFATNDGGATKRAAADRSDRLNHMRGVDGRVLFPGRIGRPRPHAHHLARLRVSRAPDGVDRTVRLFMAGPNAFAFFLGRNQVAIGRTAVYEWDFEGQRGGTYSLGLRT